MSEPSYESDHRYRLLEARLLEAVKKNPSIRKDLAPLFPEIFQDPKPGQEVHVLAGDPEIYIYIGTIDEVKEHIEYIGSTFEAGGDCHLLIGDKNKLYWSSYVEPI